MAAAVESAFKTLPRKILRVPVGKISVPFGVGFARPSPELVNQLAPEHLELAVAEPDTMADKIRHAGAIGRHTPEAIGDYIAGPNMFCRQRALRAMHRVCRCLIS